MVMEPMDQLVYSEEAKCFISSKLERLAEILKDYDPDLELRWVPRNNRTAADKLPYVIIHSPIGRQPYPVCYFDDKANPEDILARIFAGDNKQGSVLKNVEAQEAARKAFQLKAAMDAAEEAKDMTAFLLDPARSKNYVNWKDRVTGEKVKLNEFRRRQT